MLGTFSPRRGPTAAERSGRRAARSRTSSAASNAGRVRRPPTSGREPDVRRQQRGSLDRLERMAIATPAQVKAAAVRWLDAPHYTMVDPCPPQARPGDTTLDRKAVPPLGEAPAVGFPAVQRTTLKNGLSVILLERHATPIVNVALAVDAGYAADELAKAGLAALALDLFDDGTLTRDAFRVVDELDVPAPASRRAARSISRSCGCRRYRRTCAVAAAHGRRGAEPGVPGGSGRAREAATDSADRSGKGRSAGRRCGCAAAALRRRRTPTPTRSPGPARNRRSSRSPATICCVAPDVVPAEHSTLIAPAT